MFKDLPAENEVNEYENQNDYAIQEEDYE